MTNEQAKSAEPEQAADAGEKQAASAIPQQAAPPAIPAAPATGQK